MNRLKTTFHLLAFQVFIFAIHYDVNVIGWKVFDKLENKPYAIPLKGRLMFLTTWNLVSESLVAQKLSSTFTHLLRSRNVFMTIQQPLSNV